MGLTFCKPICFGVLVDSFDVGVECGEDYAVDDDCEFGSVEVDKGVVADGDVFELSVDDEDGDIGVFIIVADEEGNVGDFLLLFLFFSL